MKVADIFSGWGWGGAKNVNQGPAVSGGPMQVPGAALFNSGKGQHTTQALDTTGTLAAVYPTEESLWVYGPLVTDPGAQGVENINAYNEGGGYAALPAPTSTAELQATEDYLHEVMNGQTPNSAYDETWVNLDITGKPGYGAFNEQPFYTGHTQITLSDPASEQGWGVGPARRWAHYPFAELGNKYRNSQNHLRMGQLPWAYSEQNMLYYRTQLIWEQQWDAYKQRNPVTPVVAIPTTVPHVSNVPAYAGGFVQYQGLDVPFTDFGSGVYPDGSMV